MNKIQKMENEYKKALVCNPYNASLYNDYALFLYKYKKDTENSLKQLNRAIKFDPLNRVYKMNYLKIIRNRDLGVGKRYNFFILFVLGIMLWLGFSGYNNYMNMFSLFIVAQIVINYQKTIYKTHD